MTFFQEVYDRILHVTHARTQTELAAVLEIRQSSISDAKRRNSVPADWYMKLFEKFGLNPDWIKTGTGPMYLRVNQVYSPVNDSSDTFHEEPAFYADPVAISKLSPVYSTACSFEDGKQTELQQIGRIALPQYYIGPELMVFRIESDSFAPLILRGAYVGVDTARKHPVSGDIYAVYMPHEGVALRRLFLDGDKNRFLLRAEQPGFPASQLDADDCPNRILGRLGWILQKM